MQVPAPASAFANRARRSGLAVPFPFLLGALCFALTATSFAARPPQPSTRIPLEPLGLQPISSRYLLAGSSMLTLHYVDDTHLLVTFAARRLIRRTVDDPPTDQDHNTDALLLEIPSGRVLARAEWHLHDHGQYLWSLGNGQFMLRIRDTFTTFAPLANLATGESFLQRPFLMSTRPVVAVILSGDMGLLTIETTDPLPDPPPTDSSFGANVEPPAPKPASDVQLNLYRLGLPTAPTGRPIARVAGRAIARRPIELPVNSAGLLNVLDQGHDRWAFDFRSHAGKVTQLALFDSTCRPLPLFISPTEFLAFGCHGGTVRQQLGAFNLRGEEMWEQTLSGSFIAPSFIYAPVAGRFAIGRLVMNAAAISTDTLVPSQLNGQFVDVYQNDSGKLLLHIDCSPMARAGQNFAFSPDGMSVALIREGAVEIYPLPPLGPKDKTAIQLSQSTAPPPVDGYVDLSDPAPAKKSSVKKNKPSLSDTAAASDAADNDPVDPTLQLAEPQQQTPPASPDAAATQSTPARPAQTTPQPSQESSNPGSTPDYNEPAKPRKPPTLYNPAAPRPQRSTPLGSIAPTDLDQSALMHPHITAVHLSATHSFTKSPQTGITLLAGLGVEGDAHCGALVQHLYMVRKDPTRPNLCQIHLLQHELLDELEIAPGQLGENVTTREIDLLTLPTGTQLALGVTALLEVTGLRNPCNQINRLKPGLMKACFTHGKNSPRAGIMAIVLQGGEVRPNDRIRITLPPLPYRPLICV